MQYNVVFDITQTKFHHWSDLVGGFIFVVVAAGFFWLQRRSARRTGWRSFGYSVFITLFLLVWSLLPFFMFFHSYRNYLNIKMAMKQSQCKIAEGVVTQFHHLPALKGGGVGEAFVVSGIQFSYRDGSAQNGFHQIGIIHDGLQVRIYHYDQGDPYDKDIARLEIAP